MQIDEGKVEKRFYCKDYSRTPPLRPSPVMGEGVLRLSASLLAGDFEAGLDIRIYSKGLGRRDVIVSGRLFHGTKEFFLQSFDFFHPARLKVCFVDGVIFL